jgi:FHA domain
MSEQKKIERIKRCPKCGSDKVRQTVRRGIFEYLISLFGVYPYDCTYYTCLHRFYSKRRNSSANSQNSIDRPVLDRLYHGMRKKTSIQPEQILSNRKIDNSQERQQSGSIDSQTNGSAPDNRDSSRYDFSPSSQLQPRRILTLTWNNNGKERQHVIYSQNHKGVPAKIKLGRDPDRCDLVFTDRTVSGVNAEIYFDSQLQDFYLSNLRAINPPFLDRQKVISTAVLQSGVVLYLGRVPIAIEIGFDYAQVEPTLGFDGPTHLFGRSASSHEN